MQRAKHAERKQETRTKIMIGEAAMCVGASHLPVEGSDPPRRCGDQGFKQI